MSQPPVSLLLARVARGALLALALGAIARLILGGGLADAAPMTLRLAELGPGGALGGVVFHYLEPLRRQSERWKLAANIAGALGYLAIVAVAFALGTNR
jgi:hypothetical protein